MNSRFYIVVAFCGLVGAEAWYVRRSGRRYPLNTTVSNVSCGLLSLCAGVFSAIAFAFLYRIVETRVGFIDGLGWQWWSLILTFVLIDLCYYAYHRTSHRIAFLWGTHIVHHESDEYNLTVSLRQGALAQFSSIPFYLVPAVAGVPLHIFLVVDGVYQLYQFFVHTALVTDMGWLEHVIATPRLHRLHHARNEQYIDRNYSGFLILWDKLFGTYTEPSAEPLYGVTEPLSSWSPIWANLGYFRELCEKARDRRGWDRAWTFAGPPEWKPASEVLETHVAYVAYDARPQFGFFSAALASFVAALILGLLLVALPSDWDLSVRASVAIVAALTAWCSTRLFDGANVRS